MKMSGKSEGLYRKAIETEKHVLKSIDPEIKLKTVVSDSNVFKMVLILSAAAIVVFAVLYAPVIHANYKMKQAQEMLAGMRSPVKEDPFDFESNETPLERFNQKLKDFQQRDGISEKLKSRIEKFSQQNDKQKNELK